MDLYKEVVLVPDKKQACLDPLNKTRSAFYPIPVKPTGANGSHCVGLICRNLSDIEQQQYLVVLSLDVVLEGAPVVSTPTFALLHGLHAAVKKRTDSMKMQNTHL